MPYSDTARVVRMRGRQRKGSVKTTILLSDIEKTPYDYRNLIDRLLRDALAGLHKKIVVLDDDPTGIQTVHDVYVYTDWSVPCIEDGFREKSPLFFILTNSRSFSAKETARVHEEIARNLLTVSRKTGTDFLLVSRSDSTLRGHFPLETEVLRRTLERGSDRRFDAEILYPFFEEGGRYTYHEIHYVQGERFLIPAGQTEFAKDRTFGYTQSHLGKWVEEKTAGAYTEKDTVSVPLEEIRNFDIDGIAEKLCSAGNFRKVAVDSLNYADVKIFTLALLRALAEHRQFLFRTAASFVKVIGGIPDRPLLDAGELLRGEEKNGGLVIVGSHVQKTTEQLEALMENQRPGFVEFNQHLVLDAAAFAGEIARATALARQLIESGRTAVVYTKRQRLDLNTGDAEGELKIAVRISDALTGIVRDLAVRPKFIVAKGGITSSDVGTKGLGVRKAFVAGQIRPGVPVWITGKESRFPDIPYVVFPGNVGNPTTLKEVVEMLDA